MLDITLTVTAQNAQRIQAAFKEYWRMNTDPTLADIKQYLIRQLADVVRRRERAAAETQIADTPLDVS